MFRLCVLGLLVSALAVAAPVPKAKEKENKLYSPVRVGDKKVMEATFEGRTTERSEIVTSVSVKDGVYTVTFDLGRGGGPVAWTKSYEVSESGVMQVASNGVAYEAEVQVKLPAKVGDNWTTAQTGAGSGKRTYTTIMEEEEIEVPAGKFTTVVVEEVTERGRGNVQSIRSWYASGVGLVKFEIAFNGKIGTSVLKSFTPGKEKAEPKANERK